MKYNVVKMEDALESLIDYRGKTPKKSEVGIPTLSAKSVKNGYIDYSQCYYISKEEYDRFMVRGFPRKGDVLLTTEAPMGMVARLDRDDVGIAQRLLTLRGKKEILDNDFLLYLLMSPKGQSLLKAKETGTTVTGIKQAEFRKIELTLPDIGYQKKAASVLRSIDDKISLNQKINDNLEQQAQALMSQVMLQPQCQTVNLGDYLYIKGRIGWKGLKKSEYLEKSEFRIINGESLTTTGIDWEKAGYITRERYEESPEIMLQVGDILLSKDGTIGKIGYVDKLDSPTTVASGIFVIRNIKPELISTVFIYYLLKSPLFRSFIEARTEGSVIPHLYQKDFLTFEFLLPSSNNMRIFANATNPLFMQIFRNLAENQKLTSLRDTLLPKLMSGEIDVEGIEL